MNKSKSPEYDVIVVGALTLVTQKDGTITIENCVRRPKDFDPAHENLKRFLNRHHGFQPQGEIMRDALMLNQRSVMDRFNLGTGRVLLAGEAGRAIEQAASSNSDPVEVYGSLVQPHRQRSLREWNSIKLFWGRPGNVGEMDPKKAICQADWKERVKMRLAIYRCLSGFGFSSRHGLVLARQFLPGS